MSETDHTKELKKFSLPDAAIAELRDEYLPLKIADINDREGYLAVREARMTVKKHRVSVEKVRKFLKADALAYGRTVDGEAKRITALLTPIESHLQEEEDRHTAEKQAIIDEMRLKAEAEERAKVEAEAARVKAEADAEAARLKAIQDAENARLKAEAANLADERRKLDEEREKLNAEKKLLERIENEHLRKIEDERIAKEAAEQARIETELRIKKEAQEAKAKAEREAADAQATADAEKKETARLEALRPDREKILAFAHGIRHLDVPDLSEAGDEVMDEIGSLLENTAVSIEDIAESL